MERTEPSRAPGLAAGSVATGVRGLVWREGLWALSGLMMLADLYLVFMWAPTDATLGIVQRVFYFHVPLAWVAFLAFTLVFLGSVMLLARGSRRWDRLAQSAAELGVLFTTLVLITGAIWARPVWGIWWTWDPRLTTTLILWLIYAGYLMVWAYSPSPAQGARYAAVLGIVGFVDVPIVYFSVQWWRAIHPAPLVGPASEPGSLAPAMLVTLMFSLVTFTLFFVVLLKERLALKATEEGLHEARELARRRTTSDTRSV